MQYLCVQTSSIWYTWNICSPKDNLTSVLFNWGAKIVESFAPWEKELKFYNSGWTGPGLSWWIAWSISVEAAIGNQRCTLSNTHYYPSHRQPSSHHRQIYTRQMSGKRGSTIWETRLAGHATVIIWRTRSPSVQSDSSKSDLTSKFKTTAQMPK